MPFLGLIIAAIIGVVVWHSRLRAAKHIFDEAADGLGRAKGAYNRKKFQKKANLSPLMSIDDPVLGAAVLLVSLAEIRLPLSSADEGKLAELLEDKTGLENAEEHIAYARWACREVPDVNQVIRRLRPLWKERLSPDEREDLVSMAEEICSYRQPASSQQKNAIRRLASAIAVQF